MYFFDFKCVDCGHEFEGTKNSLTEDHSKCPKCGGGVEQDMKKKRFGLTVVGGASPNRTCVS